MTEQDKRDQLTLQPDLNWRPSKAEADEAVRWAERMIARRLKVLYRNSRPVTFLDDHRPCVDKTS